MRRGRAVRRCECNAADQHGADCKSSQAAPGSEEALAGIDH
jgi:hypothetical protein